MKTSDVHNKCILPVYIPTKNQKEILQRECSKITTVCFGCEWAANTSVCARSTMTQQSDLDVSQLIWHRLSPKQIHLELHIAAPGSLVSGSKAGNLSVTACLLVLQRGCSVHLFCDSLSTCAFNGHPRPYRCCLARIILNSNKTS